jgi:hypothetical protein
MKDLITAVLDSLLLDLSPKYTRARKMEIEYHDSYAALKAAEQNKSLSADELEAAKKRYEEARLAYGTYCGWFNSD